MIQGAATLTCINACEDGSALLGHQRRLEWGIGETPSLECWGRDVENVGVICETSLMISIAVVLLLFSKEWGGRLKVARPFRSHIYHI